MRTSILLLASLAFLFASCGKERVRITGHIANAGKMVLHLDEVDVYDVIPSDSVVLKKNGKFSFTIKTKVPCFYQLRLAPDKIIVLFPKPGEHIRIDADANKMLTSLKTKGSDDTEQITKLISLLYKTKEKLDSVGNLYESARSDSAKMRYNSDYISILEKHRKASIAYILTHYKSLSSVYALYQQYQPGHYVFYKTTDMQFFRIVSDSLSKYYPKSRHVTALKAYTNNLINDYQSQLLLSKAKKTIGLPAIKLPDTKGDSITLASQKGKYVLLSFWTSEVGEAVNQNLQWKKIYNKYKGKGFEIFQVSFDNSREEWRQEVSFDELPWINVIDTKYPKTTLIGMYNITDLPCNYLIDKDNATILAKNLTPKQLLDKLEDLCK
jgi:hypothetical protein